MGQPFLRDVQIDGDSEYQGNWRIGTAAPTAGVWAKGDIFWNESGNPVGWVCTVGGTPGTWVAISSSSSTETLTNKTLTSPVINTPTTASGVGAKNGATVTAVENGAGDLVHKTVLTLASTPVTVANVTGASFGGAKLYDFPAGRVLVLGVTASLGFVWTDEDIAQDGSGDFSLGTTITADATLDGTDVNLLPLTAMTDPFVLGVGAATANALAASAHFDGTATAIDLNLNIIIDDADVSDGASDVVLASGTVTVTWVNLGDY